MHEFKRFRKSAQPLVWALRPSDANNQGPLVCAIECHQPVVWARSLCIMPFSCSFAEAQ